VGAVLSFVRERERIFLRNGCSAATSIEMLHSRHGVKATAPLNMRATLKKTEAKGHGAADDAPDRRPRMYRYTRNSDLSDCRAN
jgi:hypothetical protein